MALELDRLTQFLAAMRRKSFQVVLQRVLVETCADIVQGAFVIGRERGQRQAGFAGELPENGYEKSKGARRELSAILRRE